MSQVINVSGNQGVMRPFEGHNLFDKASCCTVQKVLLQDVGSEDKVDILKRIARSRTFLKERADSDASAATTNSEDSQSTQIRHECEHAACCCHNCATKWMLTHSCPPRVGGRRQANPPRQSSSPTRLAALLQPTRSQSQSKRAGARRGKRSHSPVKARDLPRLKQGLAANMSEQEQIAPLQQQVKNSGVSCETKSGKNPTKGRRACSRRGLITCRTPSLPCLGPSEPTLPSAILAEVRARVWGLEFRV
jgi:hypothetical protein